LRERATVLNYTYITYIANGIILCIFVDHRSFNSIEK